VAHRRLTITHGELRVWMPRRPTADQGAEVVYRRHCTRTQGRRMRSGGSISTIWKG